MVSVKSRYISFDCFFFYVEKDISVHQYYGKDANRNGEYYDLKRSFVISRCETWNPKNKRPDKLRDAIKMLEEVLKSQEVIYLHWKSCDLLQVLC